MPDLNPIERLILRREAMKFLKAHWPTIMAALGGVLPFLMPSLLAYVQAHPHTTVGVLLGAVILAYNSTAPKDAGKLNALKALLVGVCLLGLLVPSAQAQTKTPPATSAPLTNIYAGGISYNGNGTPGIAGTGLYARSINGSGTYAFTVVDALPTSFRPFSVTSNFGAGVAQKVFSIGSIPIFVPSSAGISYNGTATGWAWSTGGMASIKLKGNWRVFPTVRVAKSSVSNGTGVQPIIGILIGYGN